MDRSHNGGKPLDFKLADDIELEIVNPRTCRVCGKSYGKTNAVYWACSVWIGCNCLPDDLAYLVNMDDVGFPEPEYMRKLASGE